MRSNSLKLFRVVSFLQVFLVAGQVPIWAGPPEDQDPGASGVVIRILAPPGGRVEGRTTIETLSIDRDVLTVVFFLDGEEVARRNRVPYEAKVPFASPPREQTVRVEAFAKGKRLLGEDSLVVNRFDPPFRVRITGIDRSVAPDSALVTAQVSVPRKAELEGVEFYLNQDLVATSSAPPFEARLPVSTPGPQDFVRVVAFLADGRSLEDVQLVSSPGLAERVEVHLVQLQVLVTDRHGAPVRDLGPENFEVRQGGKARPLERLYLADDVALVLGLALDTSGSMRYLWPQTQRAAVQFLRHTVKPRDRAFLVDFDTQLRLTHALTPSVAELTATVSELAPRNAGTALYDSILFSLLQFEAEPGRRALVVLTDGMEANSRSDPRRCVEFGHKLGVPVYVIALPAWGAQGAGAYRPGATAGISSQSALINELKLLTGPTGGRLYQASSFDQVVHAFAQINAELRNQYVLAYYAENLPGEKERPEVRVHVDGRKGLRVKTVFGLDQVN